MHINNLVQWKHLHQFNLEDRKSEQHTRLVIGLTVGMMVAEIAAGLAFGSIALLADGWHMGTHALALGITAFAYSYARRNASNPVYTFGTGKVGVLGGYTSAITLAIVALLMAVESVQRLITPIPIRFSEALVVAGIGLVVNLVSAFLLRKGHHHEHERGRAAEAGSQGHDHNLQAAYLHVLADAMTSVLAIFALLLGKSLGWAWMDPIMGIVGALVIGRWSFGLLRDTSRVLLDAGIGRERLAAVRAALESDADNRVTDLHVWPVSANHLAAMATVVTHYPRPPEHYKALLAGFDRLAHVTIEVVPGPGKPCLSVPKG